VTDSETTAAPDRVLVFRPPPDEPLARFEAALSHANELAGGLGTEALIEAMGETEKLRARLCARLTAASLPRHEDEDRLLDVEEAAKILGIHLDTLYRRAKGLPFTVRVGGSVRFSALGIQKFIRTRQGR
jgi:excisionase family DNA binding protein